MVLGDSAFSLVEGSAAAAAGSARLGSAVTWARTAPALEPEVPALRQQTGWGCQPVKGSQLVPSCSTLPQGAATWMCHHHDRDISTPGQTIPLAKTLSMFSVHIPRWSVP